MGVWILIIGLGLILAESSACPDFCYCYDDFVTCSEFTDLDLTLLPSTAETLVLSQGEMEEIPPAFFARASSLKSVEITNFNARVVRGGAFRGLNDLEQFSIKGSSFDIVEPDGFSGISGIATFLITDSHFGRVGKHAFAEITDVLDWRIWSCYFASISDEAFSAIGRVHAIQLYQNNISYIGHDIFAGAHEVEYVNFYMNTINVMANGSLHHVAKHADLLVVYANKFQCLCDNAWMTEEPDFESYLTTNECFFSSEFSISESLFRLSDVNAEILCPVTPPERLPEVTSTESVLPIVIEESWSQHGEVRLDGEKSQEVNPDGKIMQEVYPDGKIAQERLRSGNVSVNNSLHESGVDLPSDFQSSSSAYNSTSPDWSNTLETVPSSNLSVELSSLSVNSSESVISNASFLIGRVRSSTEPMLSDTPAENASPFPLSSLSTSLETSYETPLATDMLETSSSNALSNSFNVESDSSTNVSYSSNAVSNPSTVVSNSSNALSNSSTVLSNSSNAVSNISDAMTSPPTYVLDFEPFSLPFELESETPTDSLPFELESQTSTDSLPLEPESENPTDSWSFEPESENPTDSLPFEPESESLEATAFPVPEFTESIESSQTETDSFIIPMIEESFHFSTQESMSSELSHGLSSSHDVELADIATTLSPPTSAPAPSLNPPTSSPFLYLFHSSLSAHEPKVDVFVPHTLRPAVDKAVDKKKANKKRVDKKKVDKKIVDKTVAKTVEKSVDETTSKAVPSQVDTTVRDPSLVSFIRLTSYEVSKDSEPEITDPSKPPSINDDVSDAKPSTPSTAANSANSQEPSSSSAAEEEEEEKEEESPSSSSSSSSGSRKSDPVLKLPESRSSSKLKSKSSSKWSSKSSFKLPSKSSSKLPSKSSSKSSSKSLASSSSSSDEVLLSTDDESSISLVNSRDDDVAISEGDNHIIFDKGRAESSVSLLDVITPKSASKQKSTVTFPIELPYDLPKTAQVKSRKDNSFYEDEPFYDKAQRDKQIYAFPYSTSAVEMDSDNNGSTSCSFMRWYSYVLPLVITMLLSRHFL